MLIPDFEGNWDALQLVVDAAPDILNHKPGERAAVLQVRPAAGEVRAVAGAFAPLQAARLDDEKPA